MAPVAMTRRDGSVAQARAAPTADAARRGILAIAMGGLRGCWPASRQWAIDRRTPRGLMHRANADGVAAAPSDGQRAGVARGMPSGPRRKTEGVGRRDEPQA
ncbi:MAG: hypothetical protein M3178_05345 [Pseudomonadota bacterium]|nr:hypothetical protein [Pseudomonadota bacterium]